MTILLKTLEDHQYGINIGGIMHTDEAYADDISIITQTAMQMNTILKHLVFQTRVFGLAINIKKTKVMFIGKHDPPHECRINNIPLQTVSSFEYLGRVSSNNADDTKVVEDRISKSWGAFQKVKSIIR